MTVYRELFVNQGANFASVITVTDENDQPANVVGCTFSSQIRKSYYSANASANIGCSITDGPNGNVTITMAPSVTANIPAGRYVYDIFYTNTANTVNRAFEGIVTVYPRVTR
jgi:hypothetical protein